MAINPLPLRAMMMAIEATRKKENRTALILAMLTPSIISLAIIAMILYFVTNPIRFFFDFVFGGELDMIKDVKSSYSSSQNLGIYERDYLIGSELSYDGIEFTDGSTTVVYYNQLDSRWKNEPYGTDKIGTHGCGPTAMAIVVSSLTPNTYDPVYMSNWSYNNGGWAENSGSYHSMIPNCAEAFGLPVEGVSTSDDMQILVDALSSGQLVVALMGPGEFTSGGHYIVLRGVTSEGKILVADPSSSDRSNNEYDLSLIVDQAKSGASAGGPFWLVGLCQS